MIPGNLFPDLASVDSGYAARSIVCRRITGPSFRCANDVLVIMMIALSKLVFGVFIDYQFAREAYYKYFNGPDLGTETNPIAPSIMLLTHHIENCLTNLKRLREMAGAVRKQNIPQGCIPLIDRADWKIVERHEQAIKALRNAIQHAHGDLKKGTHAQAAMAYDDKSGSVVMGIESLSLVNLADTLKAYNVMVTNAYNRM